MSDKYLVRPRDVWGVGRNRLLCGDIEHGDVDEFIDRAGPPDICFTAPPWGSADARADRRKAGAEDRPVDYTKKFTPALVRAISRTKRDVGVSIIRRHIRTIERCAEVNGARLLWRYDTICSEERPCVLSHMTFTGEKSIAPNLNSMDEPVAAQVFVGSLCLKDDVLFDPLMGRGLSAMVGHAQGLSFMGCDINPDRVSEVIEKLVGAGAGEPRLISTLSDWSGN